MFSPSSTLQLRLAMVTTELDSLRKCHEEGIAANTGEKAVLRDAANRLNKEIKKAKKELKIARRKGQTADKSRAELEKASNNVSRLRICTNRIIQELSHAKRSIGELERNLHTERTRLAGMGSENVQALKSKEKILERLRETERVCVPVALTFDMS